MRGVLEFGVPLAIAALAVALTVTLLLVVPAALLGLCYLAGWTLSALFTALGVPLAPWPAATFVAAALVAIAALRVRR